MADHYAIHGGLGSPYSMKMRAVLRYRRLPHRWVQVGTPEVMTELYKHVKAPVIPVIVSPGVGQGEDGRSAQRGDRQQGAE